MSEESNNQGGAGQQDQTGQQQQDQTGQQQQDQTGQQQQDQGAASTSGNQDQPGSQAGEGGQQGARGRDDLPDWAKDIKDPEVRGLIQSKKYETPEDLGKAYRNLMKLQAKDPSVVELPNEDDEDAWNKFYERLGRPSEPNGYEFDFGDDDDVPIDDKTVDWFKKTAHEVGLTQAQAQKLANKWNEFLPERQQEIQGELADRAKADLKELKDDLGENYEPFVAAGQRLVRALDLDENTMKRIEGAVGTGPMVKLMATLGQRLGEDEFVRGVREGSLGATTREQAQAEMARLKSDEKFVNSLFDPTTANHKANKEKWARLQKAAHGDG